MALRKPVIASQTLEVTAGVGCFLLGSFLLWDAWEGRGQRSPRIVRPFTWW